MNLRLNLEAQRNEPDYVVYKPGGKYIRMNITNKHEYHK